MAVTQQLQYESRVRVRYGALAFFSALTLVGSQLLGLVGSHAKLQELTIQLIAFNQRVGLDMVGAALDLIGLVSVGVMLNWVYGVTRYRRPDLKGFLRWLVLVGAGLTAVMQAVYTVLISIKAHDFVSSGNGTYMEANQLTTSGIAMVIPLLLELGTLLLAFGAIWVSLNAMRAGLVTRAVGYAGVIAGALFIFPLGSLVPVVQGYWLASMALILAARWPSGDPPAWEAGEAVPWTPSQAQARGSRQRGGRGDDAGAPPAMPSLRSLFGRGAATPPPKEKAPKPTPAPRAGTPKRKRKRRS